MGDTGVGGVHVRASAYKDPSRKRLRHKWYVCDNFFVAKRRGQREGDVNGQAVSREWHDRVKSFIA